MEAPPYSPISGQSPPMPVIPQHAITSTPETPSTLHVCQFNTQLEQHVALQRDNVWCGFVLVSDNIDKSVNARHQTMESRNRSPHYFNSYAVLDRCDFSHLPDCESPADRSSYDMNCLLPSEDDFEAILLQFAVLVGRMLTTNIPGFEKYKLLCSRITHKYSTEMKRKSDVVSLARYVNMCYIYFLIL